jgi:peptidoglycan-associated lipoprotein
MEMKTSIRIVNGRFQLIVIFFICIGLLAIGACSKKKIRTDFPSISGAGNQAGTGMKDGNQGGTNQQTLDAAGSDVSENGLTGDNKTGAGGTQQLTGEVQAARDNFENNDIYFVYDSAALLPDSQSLLMEKAEWLQNHPQAAIVVEGHTDERGTVAYNLALGDRRAESVRAFLMELGVNVDRIRTVSYGEERPVDTGQNEAAWAKNRRAHFIIE